MWFSHKQNALRGPVEMIDTTDTSPQSTRRAVPPLLQMSAAVAALLVTPSLAHANYRLVFLANAEIIPGSPGVQGSDSFIADYNNYVGYAAGVPGSKVPTGLTWSAIVSTQAVNAVTNLDATCDATCQSLPIYLLDASEVAASQADLFGAGGGPLEGIPINQNGVSSGYNFAWTGSNSDGTAATGFELGSSSPAIGFAEVPSALISGGSIPSLNYEPVYAISNEIVGDPQNFLVPEPVSGTALLIGGLVVTRVFRRRR